jgi:hypothetical protein
MRAGKVKCAHESQFAIAAIAEAIPQAWLSAHGAVNPGKYQGFATLHETRIGFRRVTSGGEKVLRDSVIGAAVMSGLLVQAILGFLRLFRY